MLRIGRVEPRPMERTRRCPRGGPQRQRGIALGGFGRAAQPCAMENGTSWLPARRCQATSEGVPRHATLDKTARPACRTHRYAAAIERSTGGPPACFDSYLCMRPALVCHFRPSGYTTFSRRLAPAMCQSGAAFPENGHSSNAALDGCALRRGIRARDQLFLARGLARKRLCRVARPRDRPQRCA